MNSSLFDQICYTVCKDTWYEYLKTERKNLKTNPEAANYAMQRNTGNSITD